MKNKNNFQFVKANLKDFNRAYNIIQECSRWLKSKGIDQWNPAYPEKLFKKDVLNRNVYFFVKSKVVYGTVTLMTKSPFYYPKRLKHYNKNEIYICRLAVPRKFSGKGIGRKMLEEIGKFCKTKYIKKIKLDIIQSNRFLKEYYNKAGFREIKEFTPPKIGKTKFKPAILMEKEI